MIEVPYHLSEEERMEAQERVREAFMANPMTTVEDAEFYSLLASRR